MFYLRAFIKRAKKLDLGVKIHVVKLDLLLFTKLKVNLNLGGIDKTRLEVVFVCIYKKSRE